MHTVRYLLAVALIAVFAASAPAQVIAQSGFNDQTGINSNPTPNSPFNINNTVLTGQGVGESGWFTPWSIANLGIATVVNSGQAEGDGALLLQNTVGGQRTLTLPLSGMVGVSLQMKILSSATSGQGFEFYAKSQATQAIGPNWLVAANGHFMVVDGNESGATPLLDTGFIFTPGIFQTVRTEINLVTRKWDFFVDGVRYNGPHQMGFRNAPTFLDFFDLANTVPSPNGTMLDSIIVSQIPEPTSLALLGMACAAGIAGYRKRKAV